MSFFSLLALGDVPHSFNNHRDIFIIVKYWISVYFLEQFCILVVIFYKNRFPGVKDT